MSPNPIDDITRPLPHSRRPGQRCRLTGGPLAGCIVITGRTADTIRVPAHRGRYVHTDADDWQWERDAAEPTVPMPVEVLRRAYNERQGGAQLAAALELARDWPYAGRHRMPEVTAAMAVTGSWSNRSWMPGDPCAACGSRRTVWSPDAGGHCLDCHRSDADE